MYNKPTIKEPPEICPTCGNSVTIKYEGPVEQKRLVLYNLNGTSHECNERQYEKRPIGQAVIGEVVKNFQLRGRCLTITLGNGSVLSVSATGRPLNISLEGSGMILQE